MGCKPSRIAISPASKTLSSRHLEFMPVVKTIHSIRLDPVLAYISRDEATTIPPLYRFKISADLFKLRDLGTVIRYCRQVLASYFYSGTLNQFAMFYLIVDCG